jgi:regulator of RNase E activity RraA
VLVLPGDIMIADDDGAVLIPAQMAPLVAQYTI